MSNNKYHYGLGRRKTASARVRIFSGKGSVMINEKNIEKVSEFIVQPLKIVGLLGKYDVTAKTSGGGKSSQLEAVRLGISRAILDINPDFKKTLRLEGMLTRDPRAKERKKPGLKKARKAPQWSKR